MHQPKTFNLLTYKIHALGDYADTIHMFGATDSHMTQIGELAHQQLKRFYQSTNKHDPMSQLAKQERQSTCTCQDLDGQTIVAESKEKEEDAPLTNCYNLSQAYYNVINLAAFLNDHNGDPAIMNFIPRLKDHLLARLQKLEYDGDECIFMSDEWASVNFVHDILWTCSGFTGWESNLGTSGVLAKLNCQRTLLAWPKDEIDDWTSYYVNMFSGIGVGHEAQYPISTQMNTEDMSNDSDEEEPPSPRNEGTPGK
ncbi:hypothetical protein EV401DRAFT_1890216 [Pisolithus croceorrhizus]|nr:hypothetical protein EV401DRAFT_1890216 [Pisolithus croceorrhizus]